VLDDKGVEISHASKMHIIWGRKSPCKNCILEGEEKVKRQVEKYEDHWQRDDEVKTRRQGDRGRYLVQIWGRIVKSVIP